MILSTLNLGAMELSEAVLSVLAIIAFVIAVAFVIVVLVDLLLSIIDPNSKGIVFRRHVGEEKELPSRPKVLKTNAPDEGFKYDEELDERPVIKKDVNNWDDELANSEQESLLAGKDGLFDEEDGLVEDHKEFKDSRAEAIEKRKKEFEDFDTMFGEEEAPTPEAEDINRMIEEINADSIKEYEATTNTGKELKITTAPIVTEKFEEQNIESIEVPEDEEEIIEPIQQVEETEEDEPIFFDKNAEQEVIKEPVKAKVIEQPQVVENINVVTKTMFSDLTLEQLDERLEKLQNRLKINEKDLKANKKEFLPLSRVKKTLEKDQEKLRRREAIIARKKVILYGVNNYVDIDEDKAKKLSEDLDLLDGLRLSVQHCEDVMSANKDRYPILEKTNQILVEVNKDLKEDIAEIQNAILEYKNKNNID